ncbi:MAG: hypothetical protein ACIAXF_02410 [Phycisphaerales bacterium JB063]
METLPTESRLRRINHTPWRELLLLRATGRLDWALRIAEADLPDEAKSQVYRVVRRTRLWRRERVEVAHELIAHFTDGLGAGVPLADLLGSFGDVKRTAALIRRAKKRQRSIIWKVKRAAVWSVVGLVLCYAGLGVYYSFGSPTISVDYVEQLNAPAAAVAEGDRAWPMYRAALLAMGLEQRQGNPNDALLDDASPGEPGWDATEQYLGEHTASVAQLRAAASMPGLGYIAGYAHHPDDLALFMPDTDPADYAASVSKGGEGHVQWVVGLMLPQLSALRTSSRVLGLDALHAAHRAEASACYNDLVALLHLSRHANEHATLINQLVAISVVQRALETISQVITDYPDLLTDAQLVGLAHEVAAVADPGIDFTGERIFFDDFLQHFFTDDGHGDGHFVPSLWSEFASFSSMMTDPAPGHWLGETFEAGVTPALVTMMASRAEMSAMYDRLFALLVAEHETPLHASPDGRFDREVEALAGGSRLTRMKYLPIVYLMPALGAVRDTAERHEARAGGVMLGIALELHRRSVGAYPAALESLAPRYLPELPIDRITGGALGYRLGEHGPVVYSVGADRDDDGGFAPVSDPHDAAYWHTNQPADGDWVVWPLHAPPQMPEADAQAP